MEKPAGLSAYLVSLPGALSVQDCGLSLSIPILSDCQQQPRVQALRCALIHWPIKDFGLFPAAVARYLRGAAGHSPRS